MGKKIYVGNMSYKTSTTELEQLFAEYGAVASATIITDKITGNSKGFGFVEMESDDSAEKAIEALNNQMLDGRSIRVSEATEKPRTTSAPRSGGRPGGGGFGGGGAGGGRRY